MLQRLNKVATPCARLPSFVSLAVRCYSDVTSRHPHVFALIRPNDPNTGLLRALNPFAGVRGQGGPDLYSLVCVPAKTSRGQTADRSHFGKVSSAASRNQTRLSGWIVPDLERAAGTSMRGPSDARKLRAVDQVVAVNFDLHGDPYASGLLWGAAITGQSAGFSGLSISHVANLKEGYGTILAPPRRHKRVPASVHLTGLWSQDCSGAVHLTQHDVQHPATQSDGYIAQVTADRMISHAIFRNVFLKTSLADLQWELCLLWPDPTPLSAVEFREGTSGREVVGGELYATTLRAVMDGRVRVHVHGNPVTFCDPDFILPPKVVNRRAAAAGLAGFLAVIGMQSFSMCGLGLALMVASTVYPKVWRHLPPQYGGPQRPQA